MQSLCTFQRLATLAVAIALFFLVDISASEAKAPKTETLPSVILAPYVDMTTVPSLLSEIQAASGVNTFTLAFIVSHGKCTPSWGGRFDVATDTKIAANIKALHDTEGSYILSFGGYNGQELATTCTSVRALQQAYQLVLDKYHPAVLDFDIEQHNSLEDAASIDRRNLALKRLLATNPGLRIHFTLPVTPAGLQPNALALLRRTVACKLPVAVVNLMVMDFAVPVAAGGMSERAISAVQGVKEQLAAIGSKSKLGITPMIGVNDSAGETFTLDDARQLTSYALSQPKTVTELSFWSIARDHDGCLGAVNRACSGVAQTDWAFTHIFHRFTARAPRGEKE